MVWGFGGGMLRGLSHQNPSPLGLQWPPSITPLKHSPLPIDFPFSLQGISKESASQTPQDLAQPVAGMGPPQHPLDITSHSASIIPRPPHAPHSQTLTHSPVWPICTPVVPAAPLTTTQQSPCQPPAAAEGWRFTPHVRVACFKLSVMLLSAEKSQLRPPQVTPAWVLSLPCFI